MSASEASIVELYKQAAEKIVEAHSASVAAYTASHGQRPPFEQLMQETQQLNSRLTAMAVKAIEQARPQANPTEIEQLTTALHECISKAVTEFINGL